MVTRMSMMKTVAMAVALTAGVSGVALAGPHSERAQDFATQNEYLQEESTSMPHESPRVDRSAAPADPVPSASTYGGEAGRFRVLDQELQAESTSMPHESPRVNRNSVNADPPLSGAALERFLEQNSSK